jgi:hypothetical protein
MSNDRQLIRFGFRPVTKVVYPVPKMHPNIFVCQINKFYNCLLYRCIQSFFYGYFSENYSKVIRSVLSSGRK